MAKPKQQRSAKSPPRKDWKPFGREDYAEVLRGLVHFSAKTINSNTPACGVRLGAGASRDLPYVAVATTEGVPADYTSTGTNGSNATALAQIAAALEGKTAELFLDTPAGEVALIQALTGEHLASPFETGTATVGMRLRQIIVQNAQGNDLALTPLQSAGFSSVLATRIDRLIEAQESEHKQYWRRGLLGIGGSNPQNAGRYVRAMSRPLFFRAPSENPELRAAYAIHHRGIPLAPPSALLKGYIRWRKPLLKAGGDTLPATLETREQEADFLRAVVSAIEERAAAARNQLERFSDELPGQKPLADGADALMHGLLHPLERSSAWKRDFAQRLHRAILDTVVEIDGEKQTIGVGEYESVHWISIIEEAL